MAIINKIPSMVKSNVDLASYLVEDAFGSVRDISKNVVSHYTVAGSMQVNFRNTTIALSLLGYPPPRHHEPIVFVAGLLGLVLRSCFLAC